MDLKIAGNEAFKAGDWHKAADLYSQALEKDPQLPEVYANRAACSIQLQEWEKAADDCRNALKFPALRPQLHTKILWRLAVALRNIGQSRSEWEKVVEAGLSIDPANDKLLEETTYVFIESRVPPEFATTAAEEKSKEHPSESQTSSGHNVRSLPDFMPSLPITYAGLLQLVRNKSAEAQEFLYANVTGTDLKSALARPGVEPDVLDYFFATMLAHPEQQVRNLDYLKALRESPRYESALFMADDNLSSRIKEQISEI